MAATKSLRGFAIKGSGCYGETASDRDCRTATIAGRTPRVPFACRPRVSDGVLYRLERLFGGRLGARRRDAEDVFDVTALDLRDAQRGGDGAAGGVGRVAVKELAEVGKAARLDAVETGLEELSRLPE